MKTVCVADTGETKKTCYLEYSIEKVAPEISINLDLVYPETGYKDYNYKIANQSKESIVITLLNISIIERGPGNIIKRQCTSYYNIKSKISSPYKWLSKDRHISCSHSLFRIRSSC